MLLRYKASSRLESLDWIMCEIAVHEHGMGPNESIELVMRRLNRAAPSLFRKESLEVFVPFAADRSLIAGEYFFARSTDPQIMRRLKSVRGLVSLVTRFDSGRPSDVIKVSNAYVQGLIEKSRHEHEARSKGISVGAFVRMVDGMTRGYCGTVISVQGAMVVVEVELVTRSFQVATPLGNLENLSHVPKTNRVFWCQSKGAKKSASRNSN